MSQTKQAHAAPVQAKPRKDWELFWRIIAGLMLIVIGWIVWVLYQISPRSVVTPLVYEVQAGRGGAQPAEPGAAAAKPPAQQEAGATAPAPEAAAAVLRMEQAQAALRAGAHQSSADVQAAALEPRVEPVRGERLKLSTEITTPLVERTPIPQQPEARPEGAPAVPAAPAQKTRP